MRFEDELKAVLPPDVPRRDLVIEKATRHLERIVEANEKFNLTRITSPREAAIKHVYDSLAPWRLFAGATHVLDAGTGAGFPGLPLALALPETRFTLADSTQKKARFVEATVEALDLGNVAVSPVRAEDWLRHHQPDVITARAMAPLERALGLLGQAIRSGARALLYKGPDAEAEIAEAAAAARRYRVTARVVQRYDLPDGLGSRIIVEVGR